MFLHGIFLSQSLRAAIGPLQFSLRHWNLRNLTLHSGMLPYEHASRSLEIFSANTVLSHGSIMLPPHQPRVFARLARWQLLIYLFFNLHKYFFYLFTYPILTIIRYLTL